MALQITLKRKWKYCLLVIVLFLLLIELFMRVAGLALLIPSSRLNHVEFQDANRLRILTLGESTTADYFSSDEGGAWPRQLEKKLRQAGINARVYNEGLAGTISPLIVSRLPELIEKYKPQIVISMMGTNDSSNLKYTESNLSKFQLGVSQVRLFKLADWIGDWIKAQWSCQFDYENIAQPEFNQLVEKGVKLAQSAPLSKVEQVLRQELSTDREMAILLMEISIRLHNDFRPKSDIALARQFIDRAFALYPYHQDIAFWKISDEENSERCLETSLKILECGDNIPDKVLSGITWCLKENDYSKLEKKFQSRGFLLLKTEPSLVSYHYRLFHKYLEEKNIYHIAMQYPTLPLEELKSYFSNKNSNEIEAKNLSFVSNEENFSSALKSYRYDEIFSDRFKGSWGHTTDRGHELIAEAVFQSLLDLVKTKKIPLSKL